MKLNHEFELMELGDEYVAVAVGEGAEAIKGVIKMNDSGAAIFRLLMEETTIEDIIKALQQKYDQDDQVENFVQLFLSDLKKAGLLE